MEDGFFNSWPGKDPVLSWLQLPTPHWHGGGRSRSGPLIARAGIESHRWGRAGLAVEDCDEEEHRRMRGNAF